LGKYKTYFLTLLVSGIMPQITNVAKLVTICITECKFQFQIRLSAKFKATWMS